VLAFLVAAALATDIAFAGESMRCELHYAGIVAGYAWARSTAVGGALQIEAGLANAPWYGSVYKIDDWIQSTWVPGGASSRYETRFHEGRFRQDQVMELSAGGQVVHRRTVIEGTWQESTERYPGGEPVQDPLSAVYLLRTLDGDGPWEFPVFSGRDTWPLRAWTESHGLMHDTAIGTVPVRVIETRTEHKGDLEQRGRLLVYVTDDARRIPVRVVVRTNFGPVRADLVGYDVQAPG
jgi:hypothetical protein